MNASSRTHRARSSRAIKRSCRNSMLAIAALVAVGAALHRGQRGSPLTTLTATTLGTGIHVTLHHAFDLEYGPTTGLPRLTAAN